MFQRSNNAEVSYPGKPKAREVQEIEVFGELGVSQVLSCVQTRNADICFQL